MAQVEDISALESEVKLPSSSEVASDGLDDKSIEADETDIPDGGFWAWSTLFGT